MTTQTHTIAKVRALIDETPQRPYLDETAIETWIRAVMALEPGRAVWHARRLFGIGGSEIGDLIATERGVFSHSDATEIGAGKLLRYPIQPGTGDTTRGTELEPVVAAKFLEKYGAKRDTEALEHLRAFGACADYPWLVGNPDDLVVIDGRRLLPDYKVPLPHNFLEIVNGGAPLCYAAQLHHYRARCERAGVKIDGLLLVPFSLKDWEPVALEVPFTPALENEIFVVGDRFWYDYVLQGKVPERRHQDAENAVRAIAPGEVPELLRARIERAAQLKALADASYTAFGTEKTAVEQMFGLQFKGAANRLEYAGMTIATKTENAINKVTAVEALQRLGVDLTPLLKEGFDRYDDAKVLQAIQDIRNSLDPKTLASIYSEARKVGLSVTARKKGAEADYRAAWRNYGDRVVDNFIHNNQARTQTQTGKTHEKHSPLTDQRAATDNSASTDMQKTDQGVRHEQQRISGPKGTSRPRL
ncbi:MAG: hypothetical protein CVV05_00565 [Gammaproteobacteria bacterium HGW-Gammaproteobacteria-1]|jgi:hypothetical protein|nr:MAG: hypothetical protein CVV05_00565 [Gammaproteobacteria bacterium HGW-Gammaproteobacteria-1]